MQQTLVEVRDLSKEFKRSNGEKFLAVKDVSFNIQRGEIFSLLGPNGAGKTTTISMISGLLQPTKGDALICSEAPGGFQISPYDPEVARQLEVGREFMKDYRDTLRALAK